VRAAALAAVAVAASSPLATFTDTFTAEGQGKTHAVRIAVGLKAVELRLTWKKRVNGFRVTGIRLAAPSSYRAPSAASKLKITVVRSTALSRTIRVEKLRPGTLRFRIVAKDVKTPKAVCLTRVLPVFGA
jgi:hypothetical protein